MILGKIVMSKRKVRHKIVRILHISPMPVFVFALALLSTLLSTLTFSGLLETSHGALRNVNVGDEAPGFVLPHANGGEFSLANLNQSVDVGLDLREVG